MGINMYMCKLFFKSILCLLSSTQLLLAAQSQPILIENVTIIDSTGSGAQPGMNVLIRDGIVASIGTDGSDKHDLIPQNARSVDASGLFLVPGYWDMHVHAEFEWLLPLFIANGVTGVRQMWGTRAHRNWRRREGETGFISPRFYIASNILEGERPIWPRTEVVRTPEEGRDAVRRAQQGGADFVKVYSGLNRDAYFAIAEESEKRGIPFAGHVPGSITPAEASAAGQKSIEHLSRIHDSNRSKEQSAILYQLFVSNGTWQSPTLSAMRNIAYWREREVVDIDRMAFFPKWHGSRRNPQRDFRFANNLDAWKDRHDRNMQLVAEMNEAGVRFIAGTDMGNPYSFAGFSLHDEMELLVEAGLTPMQSLQTATRNAAEFMGRLDTLGTVEQGKIADLVLLRANPLTDIRNTTEIEAVIFNGELLDRNRLDEMLANAKMYGGC